MQTGESLNQTTLSDPPKPRTTSNRGKAPFSLANQPFTAIWASNLEHIKEKGLRAGFLDIHKICNLLYKAILHMAFRGD